MWRFVPTSRLVVLGAVPVGLALLTLVRPAFVGPMLVFDGALVLVALVDALLGARPRVTTTRHLPRVLSVGRDNAVEVEVRSQARRTLVALVKDDVPAEIGHDGPVRLLIPPAGVARATYHVVPSRRGAFTLGDTHVRVPTPLGLWWRQLRERRSDPLRVYPDLRAVRTYELLARQNREALLARAARLRGGEREFERLREHRRDDPFRSIDWRATARRQRLIVREYQKERDQHVLCVLDCGRLMTAEAGGLSYLDHALNATLMMAHVAARAGDHVGLLAFDRAVRTFLPPQGGAQATQRMVTATYDLHPDLVESNFAAPFDLIAARVPKRTLVVVFTQVVDDVSAGELAARVRALPGRHLPVCVLFRDPAVEALLAPEAPEVRTRRSETLEPYVRGAAAEVALWNERVVRTLRAGGAHVLHTAPEGLTPALVNRYLEIKARALL